MQNPSSKRSKFRESNLDILATKQKVIEESKNNSDIVHSNLNEVMTVEITEATKYDDEGFGYDEHAAITSWDSTIELLQDVFQLWLRW